MVGAEVFFVSITGDVAMVRIDMELADLEMITRALSSLIDRMEGADPIVRAMLEGRRERLGELIDKFQDLVGKERKFQGR